MKNEELINKLKQYPMDANIHAFEDGRGACWREARANIHAFEDGRGAIMLDIETPDRSEDIDQFELTD